MSIFSDDAKTLPDDWEETLRKEVAEATELVWAQAEAWIEAEAEAEEEEWRILEMGINNYVGLASSELDAAISSPGDWLGTAPPGLEGSNRRKGLSVSTFFEDPILETPLVGRTDESRIIRSARSAKSLDDRYDSPTTSYFSLAGNLSGRGALHSKLSSPDRRRFISPADALKRYESKLSVAETNRDRSVAAKVQKAMQVTNRVKERMQRAAEKHQLAEEALQDKLKHAEKRHEKHINGIRVRAGNENAKVNGVLFSTLANSEAIAQALQQKLEEVEARILAASQRREQRLAGISGSQRKKNSRKVQQMSEFKMQLERQKMERWEKLQQKLEQVKSRREARFAELKLRAEADARRLEALLAEKAAEKATERDSTSTSTPKRVRQSESALQPNTPQLLNAAEQQTTPSTSPNPEPVALPLTEFPASPPRIARGSDDSASPCSLPQLLSTTSLKLSFLKFQDSIQKAKVLSTFDDAWEQCLKIAHSSASNGLIGIRCLVHEATSSRTDADRIDSGSKLYSSILEQLNNMEEPGIAETVNCIVQGALDNARAGHWDRLKDFAEQGGVLLSSAVLSRDLGTLRSFQSLCSFLELSKPSNMADDISRDQIEFGNLLELLDLMMNSPDETMKKLMLSHGLHLSIADIIHFLLLFASSKMVVADPGPSIGETSPVTPQLLRSGLHVNSMLCKLSEILLALITTAQELSQSSSECMELLRSFMDYCFLSNMMALVVQYGQVVLAETQCESASKPSTPSQSTDAFVLRNIEGRRAFWSVSNLVQAIAGYVR